MGFEVLIWKLDENEEDKALIRLCEEKGGKETIQIWKSMPNQRCLNFEVRIRLLQSAD